MPLEDREYMQDRYRRLRRNSVPSRRRRQRNRILRAFCFAITIGLIVLLVIRFGSDYFDQSQVTKTVKRLVDTFSSDSTDLVAPSTHPSVVLTRVIDGDTVDLRRGTNHFRVRLAEIDAPEKRQPGGQDAKRKLRLLLGQSRNLYFEQTDSDQYGRAVG